jgi:hypothetical protein
MMRVCWTLMTLAVAGLPWPAVAQLLPEASRDPVSNAFEAAQEEVERMATTKIEKFSRWNRAGFTRRARQVQFRQQTQLVDEAGKLASSGYLKTLGWVNTLSDSVATVGGHLVQKDLRGAAVAAVDEGAQSMAAAGGAWALGKLGAGVGLTFGGPPGMMVGGAVCGVVGAVAATVGYNAYASDAVTSGAEAVLEPPEPENYYREEARKNRLEWLVANGYPIPAILLEQDWAERDRQIRTPDAAPPPVFVVGPPDAEQTPAAPKPTVTSVPPESPAGNNPSGALWAYQGVWLPEKYLPAGFRHYDSDRKPQGDPPVSNGSQTVWYGIPLKKKGGQSSASSGEHPLTVYIDGVTIYTSLTIAKQEIQSLRNNLSCKTSVPLGEEAYLRDDLRGADGSIFTEFSGHDGVWRRDIHVYLIRVGRVVFGLRVSGDRVKDFDPDGSDHRDFVAYETPSREQIMQVAETFVGAMRRYAGDKGWLSD